MSPLPSKMHVTADCVAVRCGPHGGLEVLLIRRARPPYQGQWALPGGFVELEEDVPEAAVRELKEETSAAPRALELVGVWGKPGRDPRGRVVTAAFLAVVGPECGAVRGADDAAEASWHAADRLPPLAFDHADIIDAALARLRELCERTHLAFAFLNERFELPELRDVLGAVSGRAAAAGKVDSIVERACLERLGAGSGSRDEGPVFRCVERDFLAPLR